MTTDASAAKSDSSIPDGVERTTTRAVFRPRVDIIEGEDSIVLVADLPGVDESGVDITLDKHVLTIRGTVAPVEMSGQTLAYREYDEGDFERAFTISAAVDRDAIEATVKNGVLRVRLPRSKQAGSQKIQVRPG